MQVLCTSYSTARYILERQQQQQQQQQLCNGSSSNQQQQQQQQKSKVYIVGEEGLLDELRRNGIDAIGGPEGTNPKP